MKKKNRNFLGIGYQWPLWYAVHSSPFAGIIRHSQKNLRKERLGNSKLVFSSRPVDYSLEVSTSPTTFSWEWRQGERKEVTLAIFKSSFRRDIVNLVLLLEQVKSPESRMKMRLLFWHKWRNLKIVLIYETVPYFGALFQCGEEGRGLFSWCAARKRRRDLFGQKEISFFDRNHSVWKITKIVSFTKTPTDAAFGGWCEACGAKLASLAFEEHSNVNETFCEIFKLVWVIGEKEGGMEEDVCVIAKLTSSSTWRWNEIECQSSGHF